MVVVVAEKDAGELGPSGAVVGEPGEDAGDMGPFGAVAGELGMLFVLLVVLGG